MLEAGIQVTRDPLVPEDDQEVGSEDVGWLLLNDELISRLDMNNYQIARGVAEMARYFNDHEGSIVSYEDFTVGVPGGSER